MQEPNPADLDTVARTSRLVVIESLLGAIEHLVIKVHGY
jgi:hypothetical protein